MVLSNEHRRNIGRIILFIAKYRKIKGIAGFQEPDKLEAAVGVRDGSMHETLFEFLIYTRPFTGEDWRLITTDPVIAASAVYHIEVEQYEGKEAILAPWRELSSVH